MYLPFIQDLIQLECQNSWDSYGDADTKRDSTLVNQALESVSSLAVNVGPLPLLARSLSSQLAAAGAWVFSEPHDIREPASNNIPSIRVTPADSTEPPKCIMHAQTRNQYSSSSCNIRTTSSFEPGLSPYYCSSETPRCQQQNKSATEAYNEWFCLPFETAYRGNGTKGALDVRQLVTCAAEVQPCPAENNNNVMVLWRPTNIDQQPRSERRYSRTQPTVYPFHTKRNSI